METMNDCKILSLKYRKKKNQFRVLFKKKILIIESKKRSQKHFQQAKGESFSFQLTCTIQNSERFSELKVIPD